MKHKITYDVLVTLNEQGNVVELFSPHFGSLKSGYTGSANYLELHHYLKIRLYEKVAEFQQQHLMLPRSYNPIKKYDSAHAFFISVQLDIDRQERFFSRNLPRLGVITNFISVLVTIFMTYLSLCLLFISTTNDKTSRSLATAGCFIVFVAMMLQYHFSEANHYLNRIGHNLDRWIAGEKNSENLLMQNLQPGRKFVFYCMMVILRMLSIGFSFISSVMLRQAMISITTDATENQVIPSIPDKVNAALALTAAIIAAIQNTAFNQGFVDLFLEYFFEKIQPAQSQDPESQPLLHPGSEEKEPNAVYPEPELTEVPSSSELSPPHIFYTQMPNRPTSLWIRNSFTTYR